MQVEEATQGTLHLRTRADLGALAGPVREILRNMGHEQVVVMSTIDRLFENWLVAERMGAAVITAVTIPTGVMSARYTLRTGPRYLASCVSLVSSVTPSHSACDSSSRSKGSWWSGGNCSMPTACSLVIGSSA